MAVQQDIHTVVVRPSDVDLALRAIRGSNVRLGSVVGYPHGSENTAAKLYACRDLIRRGAQEIDAVLNIGKLVSRQWLYLETELVQLVKACHEQEVVLKAIFGHAYLDLEQKIVSSKIAKRAEADFISAPPEDLQLVLDKAAWRYKAKVEGAATLEQVLELHRQGADRISATQTEQILTTWRPPVS